MNVEFPPLRDQPEPAATKRGAPWAAPPENELGMPVPYRFTIVSTPTAWLRAGDFVAHSTGFRFETRGMLTLTGDQAGGGGRGLFEAVSRLLGTLRLSLVLAGGQVVAPASPGDKLDRPDQPMLVQGLPLGGGGSSYWWSNWSWWDLWWMRPLPPAGPIQLVCSWEGMALSPSTITFDSEPLRVAARSVLRFWE